ncbi:MAG: hypothetical protein O2916_11750 [Proteobacteria bacterium]|nr:hypothetical protein [Pseudomonadota bacterium]
MKISCNWVKTKNGNSIKEGNILKINAVGASHISGGIFKNGFPVLAIFGLGSKASIKVFRKNKSLKGKCILKIRAFNKFYKGSGIDDIFNVI